MTLVESNSSTSAGEETQHVSQTSDLTLQDYYKNSPLRHYHNHYRTSLVAHTSATASSNQAQQQQQQQQQQQHQESSGTCESTVNSKKRRPQSITSEEEEEEEDEDDVSEDSDVDELVIDTNGGGDIDADDEINEEEEDNTSRSSLNSFEANTDREDKAKVNAWVIRFLVPLGLRVKLQKFGHYKDQRFINEY